MASSTSSSGFAQASPAQSKEEYLNPSLKWSIQRQDFIQMWFFETTIRNNLWRTRKISFWIVIGRRKPGHTYHFICPPSSTSHRRINELCHLWRHEVFWRRCGQTSIGVQSQPHRPCWTWGFPSKSFIDAFGWNELITIPDAINVNRNLISEYELSTKAQGQHYHQAPMKICQLRQLRTVCSCAHVCTIHLSLKQCSRWHRHQIIPFTALEHHKSTMHGSCFLKLFIMRWTVDHTWLTVSTIRTNHALHSRWLVDAGCW